MSRIPFNKPYLAGKELDYIKDAVSRGKISGNGYYTHLCHEFFKKRYGFKECLLTTSGTDALEMAAILCDVKPGDEVIVPSYTFVSTANAFVLRGAKIVFADSRADHPGIDEEKIEALITKKTKVIVIVHYAGIACDMDVIMNLAAKYKLFVVEDAALAIDSYYKGRPLGSIGHFGCFSFHETKNIQCGEGGMLVINDEEFIKRAEIIWEKGTNRVEFYRGEVNKYGWVDIGSSFLPSEINAAFLYAQLESLDAIQLRRKKIWGSYWSGLEKWSNETRVQLPNIPEYATNNAHMFYLVCKDRMQRTQLIDILKRHDILSVFHYLSLHKSPYYQNKYVGKDLKESDIYSDCLVRLPLYFDLEENDVKRICKISYSSFLPRPFRRSYTVADKKG